MAEHHNQQQYYQQPQQQLPPTPMSSERRIVRSTSGRDRHSKVSTSKGLRDRRVRLSAHTAIRFYDVQDRLGYDRPSKAVDWLIRNARAAIDELPPCPHSGEGALEKAAGPSTSVAGYGFDSNFLPPSLDSDAIAETIKSFFPVSHAATPPNFQGFPPQAMPYNTGSQVHEDLRLSLQSTNHPITTTITTTTTTGDTIVLDAASGSWTHASSSPKMSSWVVDGSALETALGQGSAWINDHTQMQISPFGSAGFSNCYQIDEDHNDISPTNGG